MALMDLFFILLILVAFMLLVYLFFFRKYSRAAIDEVAEEDKFSLDYLVKEIPASFDVILKTNYSELNLNKYETQKNDRNKAKLRNALKTCAVGNLGNKLYVKDYIKDLLQRKYGINEETINLVIPFDNPNRLSAQDKFEILLQFYRKLYDLNALSELFDRSGFDKPKTIDGELYYEVTRKDMELVYRRHEELLRENFTFADKLEVLSQRVYQLSKGLGVIDGVRDMVIDGVHCGTSGIPSTFYTYGADAMFGAEEGDLPKASCNSIWLMLHGKLIHLSFMGFGSDKELERVAKVVYRNGNPGTLSAKKGYIVNDMQDGSRVVALRPPMAESWMFFIRKFDVGSKMPMEKLYPFEGVDKLIALSKYLVKGCRNIAITGQQATGKSTFMMSFLQFLPLTAAIRVQEMMFELNLRKIYPNRDIATLKETAHVSGQEGLDIQKKMDGSVNVLGEVAQASVASWAIQMGKVGSAQVIFTHHAKTTEDLVSAFRDNMIEAAGYNNEKIVESSVAKVLNFDVHLSKNDEGVRFVERITEITPVEPKEYPTNLEEAFIQYFYNVTDRKVFESHNVLEFDQTTMSYKFTGELSDYSIRQIKTFLNKDQRAAFEILVQKIHEEVWANADNSTAVSLSKEAI